MKSRSLVSCILLSSLVILLLSTATQATEYREVKAEEILKHIENGEDVNLTDCRIVGELNASKMKLETVPNPYFYKLLKEGIPKEALIYYGLSENLRVIESNITITNSVFGSSFYFSGVLFNGSADFSRATFNSSAGFSGTTFNSSANFSWATFNSSADFNEATFNSSADFNEATFNSSANFRGPDTSENIITDGKTCEFFMRSYNNEARYRDADNIYYNYRKNLMNQNMHQDFIKYIITLGDKSLTSFSMWIDILSWVTCGYGTKPFNSGCLKSKFDSTIRTKYYTIRSICA